MSAANTTSPDTKATTIREKTMLLEQTREQLRSLKLTGMLDALERQIEQPETHDLAFEHRVRRRFVRYCRMPVDSVL